MTYAVKETFYTLQGEGANAGRPAVFLRFTGCNLWTGRSDQRDDGPGGCSRWCDTDFVGTDGPGGGRFKHPSQLAEHVEQAWQGGSEGRFVVCTGGEPSLQLDSELLAELHQRGFEVAVETNGTRTLPDGIDWICVSPKAGSQLIINTGQELKLVVPQEGLNPSDFAGLDFKHFFLQPLDGPARALNTAIAVDYCKNNPRWRLSLQTHKYIGIP